MAQSTIGIDLGTKTIKAVELIQKKGKPFLLSLGEIPVPANVGSVYSSEASELLASYIKKLMTDAKMRGKKIISSIPSDVITTSIITLPDMPREELEYAMKFQLGKYVPEYPKEKHAFWDILSHGKEYKILIAGVDNIVVNHFMDVFKKSGLELASLEIEASALSRILIGKDSSGIIIHMSSKYTCCILVENGAISMIRNVKVGEDTLILSLKTKDIDYEKAKSVLYEYGLLKFKNKGNTYVKVKPFADQITQEVERMINYYEQKNGRELKKVILSGAGAFIPDITNHFISELSKDTVIADPWANIEYSFGMDTQQLVTIGPRFVVACGLAIQDE